jgi:hypothetical protein
LQRAGLSAPSYLTATGARRSMVQSIFVSFIFAPIPESTWPTLAVWVQNSDWNGRSILAYEVDRRLVIASWVAT